MTSTLILSDLHLGSQSGSDLLRRPQMREALLGSLEGIDRVILLGDILELRHGPVREAIDAARPFFEELGHALRDRELIMTAGNHDHALVEPWLQARGAQADPGPLEAQQLFEAVDASPALGRIAEMCAPARVRVAYPGFWVREDVYAMHGHYLDCHLTVPTLERLSVAAMSRVLGRPADTFEGPEDYEAMGATRLRLARRGRPQQPPGSGAQRDGDGHGLAGPGRSGSHRWAQPACRGTEGPSLAPGARPGHPDRIPDCRGSPEPSRSWAAACQHLGG